MNLLFVDDNVDMRFIYSTYFRKMGIKVTEASNWIEALWKLKIARFDLVLFDIIMPVCDWIDFIKSVEQEFYESDLSNTKFIALSNVSDVQEVTSPILHCKLVKSAYSPAILFEKLKKDKIICI